MKHLSSRWLGAVLLGPVLLLGLLLVFGSRPEAATAGGFGFVQVAFTGSATTVGGVPIAQAYQRVLLNVISVRLNPSTNLNIAENDPNWRAIAAPANVGLQNPSGFIVTNTNFGGSISSAELGTALSVIQLDFQSLQNLPVFFNTGRLPAKTYNQVELQLNATNQGNVVPLCPQSQPAGEGCLTYPITVPTQGAVLRTKFANPYNVTRGTIQPLVINIAVAVGAGPTKSGSPVTVIPVITPQGNALLPNSTLTSNPALATVTGVLKGFNSKTTVTAELSGTNQIVASAKPLSSGLFVLNLPASPTPNFTLYDFYVSGNGAYIVRSRVPVSSQGTSPTLPQTNLGTLVVPPSTLGGLSGAIFDACVGTTAPIQAATLELLVPDTSTGGGNTCELTGDPPAIPSNCVVVATANTDETGQYPLPATQKLPQAFNHVPHNPPSGVPFYDLVIAAPGYNTSVQEVEEVVSSGFRCPAAGFNSKNACSFNLEHGFLTGATALDTTNDTANPLDVLVLAEDSGTDHIENFGLSIIPVGETFGTYSMPVPDAAPSSSRSLAVSNYDVFGAVQDLFQNTPTRTSGHSIATIPAAGAPPAACATASIAPLAPFDCVGLGSVFGSVISANPNTTSVRLSKGGVQIMETEANSIGVPPNGNNYNFCAPADSYVLTHYESGVAQSSVPIALPTPITVATPCATICQNSQTNGAACLVCQPAAAPLLP